MIASINSWSTKHIIPALLSVITVLSCFYLFGAIYYTTQAADTLCSMGAPVLRLGSGSNYNLGNGFSGQSEVIPIYLGFNAAPPSIKSVEFILRQNTYNSADRFLAYGVAAGVGTDTSTGYTMPGSIQNWKTVWDSSLTIPNTTLGIPNSLSTFIRANVTFNDTAYPSCYVENTTAYTIQNQYYSNSAKVKFTNTSSTILSSVIINAGEAIDLKAQGRVVNSTGADVSGASDITPYLKYTWYSNPSTLGPIQLDGTTHIGHFVAGGTDASGSINVSFVYAGRSWASNIPVQVKIPVSSGDSSTTINTTSTSGGTASSSSSGGTSTTTSATTKTISTAAPATTMTTVTSTDKSCIESTIGTTRYLAITQDASTPTPEELTKMKSCLESRNYIVPTVFAPVKPNTIKSLPLAQSSSVSISKLENDTIKTGSASKTVLVFRGKSTPYKKVFLYVFSTPLVITTEADKDGNWVYELENPVTPGEHEVYAVVDRGNGQYEKSDPFSFIIGKAEASASNPEGLSLELQIEPTPKANNRSIYLYIAGVIILLIVGIVVLFILLKRRSKKDNPTDNIDITNNTNPPADPTIITPTIGTNQSAI